MGALCAVKNIFITVAAMGMIDWHHTPFCEKYFPELIKRVETTSVNSANVVEALIGSFSDICIYMDQAITQGSLSYLFSDPDNIVALQSEYLDLMRIADLINVNMFNSVDAGMTIVEYETSLHRVRGRFDILRKTAKDHVRQIFMSYIRSLDGAINSFVVSNYHGKLRIQPFAISVSGPTSVGKSCITQNLLYYLCKIRRPNIAPHNIARQNPQENFDSALKADSYGILLDDMCNQNIVYDKSDPIVNILIRIINNAPEFAMKSEIKDKGTVPIHPDVVAVSTNDPLLQAETRVDTLCILRRFQVHLSLNLKKKYQNH